MLINLGFWDWQPINTATASKVTATISTFGFRGLGICMRLFINLPVALLRRANSGFIDSILMLSKIVLLQMMRVKNTTRVHVTMVIIGMDRTTGTSDSIGAE